MQSVTALVTVIAAANWIGFIGGLVLAVAKPSLERAGVVAAHAVVTALLIWVMFLLLEHTHGSA